MSLTRLSENVARSDALLFGEAQSRIIVAVNPETLSEVERRLKENGAPYTPLGITGGDVLMLNYPGGYLKLAVEKLREAYESPLREALA